MNEIKGGYVDASVGSHGSELLWHKYWGQTQKSFKRISEILKSIVRWTASRWRDARTGLTVSIVVVELSLTFWIRGSDAAELWTPGSSAEVRLDSLTSFNWWAHEQPEEVLMDGGEVQVLTNTVQLQNMMRYSSAEPILMINNPGDWEQITGPMFFPRKNKDLSLKVEQRWMEPQFTHLLYFGSILSHERTWRCKSGLRSVYVLFSPADVDQLYQYFSTSVLRTVKLQRLRQQVTRDWLSYFLGELIL